MELNLSIKCLNDEIYGLNGREVQDIFDSILRGSYIQENQETYDDIDECTFYCYSDLLSLLENNEYVFSQREGVLHIDDCIWIDEGCDYFFNDDDDIYWCDYTNEYHLVENMVYLHDVNEGCYYGYAEDNFYRNQDGDWYTERESNIIYDYHDYDGDYYPRGVNALNNQDIYLGYELEVDNVSICDEELAESAMNYVGGIDNYLHCEFDSSVEFEFVSQPATLEYHKQQNIKEMLHYLSKHAESHNARTCGLHIHVNKYTHDGNVFLSDEEQDRLILICEYFKKELFQLSRRNDFYSSYCSFDNDPEKNLEKCIKNIEKNKSKSSTHSNYLSFRKKTIEFRFFRGTLKYSSFMASLEFVNNLVKVVKENRTIIKFTDLIQGEYIYQYAVDKNIECSDVLYTDFRKDHEQDCLNRVIDFIGNGNKIFINDMIDRPLKFVLINNTIYSQTISFYGGVRKYLTFSIIDFLEKVDNKSIIEINEFITERERG